MADEQRDADERWPNVPSRVGVADNPSAYCLPIAVLPDAILVVDSDGRAVAANPAAAELLGCEVEMLIERPVDHVVAPWPIGADEVWERVEVRRGDGRRLPVAARSMVLPEDGSVTVLMLRQECQHVAVEPIRGDPMAWIAAAPGAVVETAPDGTITAWDRRAEELFGYRADEAIGRPEALLAPADLPDEVAALRKQVLQGDAVCGLRTTRQARDGRRLDVVLALRPRRDERGRIEAVVWTIRDVTGPMAATAALRASEARFRAAFADAPIGMALTEPGGRFVQVNRALCEILGYDEAALLATALLAVTHADDRTVDREHAERLLAGAIPAYQVEKRFVRRDGRVVVGRLSVSLVRDEAGQPRYVVSQIQDITPYKAAGAALRASEARFRAAFADAPIGMALTEPGGRFVQVNRALCEILGYDEAALLATALPAVTHAEDRDADREQAERLLAGTIPTYQVEKRFVRRDGRDVWGEFSASLVRDEAGQPLHLVCQVQDVTERRRAEGELRAAKEAAEAASRLKSAFLSTMSHELRTPLTAIMGYAELLLGGDLGAQEVADAEQVSRSAHHLLALVDDLLDLSRIEAGRLALVPEAVDPAAAVAAVAAEVAPTAAAKGLVLAVDAPEGLPMVQADPLRLRQALLNLAGNAVKFTEQGGVRLAARPARGGVEVTVADDGIGIAAEALPHIFDEFRQADGSTTRRYGGTGLGLAITKRLVEAHGGALRAESAPGVGSTFTIWLPVAPTEEDRAAAT